MKQQLQVALTLLSLISSAVLQRDVHKSGTGQPNNVSLRNNNEVHTVLRKIEKFIEAKEIADGVQAGECCLVFPIYSKKSC